MNSNPTLTPPTNRLDATVHNSRLETLRKKLLYHDGDDVQSDPDDEYLAYLLLEGHIFPRKGLRHRRRHRGPTSQATSSRLWYTSEGTFRLVTGYALGRDGVWRPHTWCIDQGYRVVETTDLRFEA